MTDIEIVRKHVLRLIDAGHTQRTIGQASGVPRGTVDNVIRRDFTVKPQIYAALMAVEVRPPWETPGVTFKPLSKVPGVGTVRRIQALVYMGYPILKIAKVTGLNEDRLRILVKSPHALVTVRTADLIRRFYRDALLREPTGRCKERTRRWAQSNGWRGPGTWDDIDRDPWPVREGDLGVLIDYVEENPGLTTTKIRSEISQGLGMPVSVADRLIKEALDTQRIVRLRRHRTVRVYTSDWKEGDQDGIGEQEERDQVRQAAVS